MVTVKNNTSSELTDYTVSVDLDTNALIAEGKLQPDCNDIRFVLFNGTELNYWVQSTDVAALARANPNSPTTAMSDCSSTPVYLYVYVAHADQNSILDTNWYSLDFNDADWNVGHAPFGNTGGQCTTVLSSAPDDLFVRKWFYVAQSRDVTLHLATDDGARCYVNGHLVLDRISDAHGASYWNYTVDITPYVRDGNNLLACWVANGGDNSGGGNGYFDAEIVLESTCMSPNTYIWVKIPEIPASGETNVYLYYGDSNAVSESNGDATFLLFDDFGYSHYDWNAPGLNVTYKPDQSVVELTMKDNANQEFFLPIPASSTYAVSARMYCPQTGEYTDISTALFGGMPNENQHPDTVIATLGKQSSKFGITYGDTSTSWTNVASVSVPSSIWSSVHIFTLKVYENNVWGSLDANAYTLSGSVPQQYIFHYAGLAPDLDSGDVLDVDWILVRKYVYPEPSVTVGTEEQTS